MRWAPTQVEIADPRSGDRHLRVAWHARQRTVVVSQWRGSVCVASTPLEIGDVAGIVNLLVGALAEASTSQAQERRPTPGTIRQDVATILRARLHPRLAPIVALRPNRRRTRSG